MCVLVLLCVSPGTSMCVSSYYCVCVLVLLCVLVLRYVCPHTNVCAFILLFVRPCTIIVVSSYHCICVLMLRYSCHHASTYEGTCRNMRTAIYVSSYSNICDIIRMHMYGLTLAGDEQAQRSHSGDVCRRMLTYADVYRRMLTYADVI